MNENDSFIKRLKDFFSIPLAYRVGMHNGIFLVIWIFFAYLPALIIANKYGYLFIYATGIIQILSIFGLLVSIPVLQQVASMVNRLFGFDLITGKEDESQPGEIKNYLKLMRNLQII